MGATNTTTYYNLSQFIGTDKPAWLHDYNGDMLKIDTGINAAKLAADAAALDAGAAQNTANDAVSSIVTLNATVGAHTTAITNLSGSVNTINSLIGNGTPTTTDQTIIGAINEINAKTTVGAIVNPVVSINDGNIDWFEAMRLGGLCELNFRFTTNTPAVAITIPNEYEPLCGSGHNIAVCCRDMTDNNSAATAWISKIGSDVQVNMSAVANHQYSCTVTYITI